MTKDILLHEIAEAIVGRREDIIDLLNNSGVHTDSSINAQELTTKVVNNLSNKKFVEGLVSIISKTHKEEFDNFVSADGNKDSIQSTVVSQMGNVTPSDTEDVQGRVDMINHNSKMESKGGSGGGWVVVGILTLSAVAIFAIVKTRNKKG